MKRLKKIEKEDQKRFWAKYQDRVCEFCGFLLEGNDRITGCCEICREKQNAKVFTPEYFEKERLQKKQQLEQKQSAKRAK